MFKMLIESLKIVNEIDNLIDFEYGLLYEIEVVKLYLCKQFD